MMLRSRRLLFCILLVFGLCNILTCVGRFVTHKKKDQATLDKEVLLEDEDYDDDDVLNMKPEEQKERLQMLVEKKIDANHDGFVDARELQAWCVKAFDQFEFDDIKDEFEMIDANKDGLVSWEEFVEDMFGDDFEPETSDKKTIRLHKKDEKLYKAADADGDAKLDQEEYVKFRIPRSDPDMRRIVLEDALESYDLDKDGSISLEEYLQGSHDEESRDFGDTDEDRFHDEFDGNEDNLLTGDEIRRWVDPDNRDDAYDEADHLMSECDANKDEKLSAEEIVNNHDIWVESDATDYGKQLLMNHDEF